MSKVCQIISVIKTQWLVFPEKWYFKKKSLFWHLNSVLSWRQQKVSVRNTSVYVFIIENWHSKKTELWIFIKRKISVSGILHMKFWRKLTVCVDSLVCAVASLRLISLEAVGPLSLGSSHFKKARRVASSYIYWSLKKDNNIYRFITIHILYAYIEEKRPQILLSKFVLRGNN